METTAATAALEAAATVAVVAMGSSAVATVAMDTVAEVRAEEEMAMAATVAAMAAEAVE